MDQEVVDRIRSASFPLARKGYEKRNVDGFLDDLADWLENAAEEGAHSDSVRRELQRIGEQTTAILTEAHDAADTMRTDADRQVRQQLADANIKAEELRDAAEEYAEEVREEADSYARRVRGEADAVAERARIEAESAFETERGEAEEYAARVRREAEEFATRVRDEAEAVRIEAREKAERSAKQIVEEANRRRSEVEKVISDLEDRRQAIVGELRRLASAAGIAEADGPMRPPENRPIPDTDERPVKPDPQRAAEAETRPLPTRVD